MNYYRTILRILYVNKAGERLALWAHGGSLAPATNKAETAKHSFDIDDLWTSASVKNDVRGLHLGRLQHQQAAPFFELSGRPLSPGVMP
jgi:hypothetical protein